MSWPWAPQPPQPNGWTWPQPPHPNQMAPGWAPPPPHGVQMNQPWGPPAHVQQMNQQWAPPSHAAHMNQPWGPSPAPQLHHSWVPGPPQQGQMMNRHWAPVQPLPSHAAPHSHSAQPTMNKPYRPRAPQMPNKGGTREEKDRAYIERELDQARQVLAKLGKKVPGDSPEEIALYIAERKRLYPRGGTKRNESSKKNGVESSQGNALAELAAAYSGSEDEDSDKEWDNVKKVDEDAKKRRNEASGGKRKNRPGDRGPKGVGKKAHARRHGSWLLSGLLRDEVSRERGTLLAALEYLQ